MKVRVEVIKRLDLYEPASEERHDAECIVVNHRGRSVRYAKYRNHDFPDEYFFHYPILIDPDGSPWPEANRYLLSRLCGILVAKHRTLESIANDLANFRQWLFDEGVDFLNVPKRQRARPTYRYCGYLHDEVRMARIKPSTAKRRICSVQGFYRWLQMDGKEFDFPLWQENAGSLYFKDKRGFGHHKSITSTDLSRSFRIPPVRMEYSEYIEDGGKLRPLPKEEQIALVESLRRIGNIEMFLSFMFALMTGARLQTVFTLRRTHFSSWLPEGERQYRLKVGAGTLINTKNGKRMTLFVPAWLYRRIQVYMNCERCQARVRRSPHVYESDDLQYVFLTRSGKPYYMADNDPFSFLYRSPPRGNSITQFIRQQLKPDLLAHGHSFEIRFHDLRATFGMNLLVNKLPLEAVGSGASMNNPEMLHLLMYVRERMGHSQLSTTELYLKYRQRYKLALGVQDEYEAHLESLVESFEVEDVLD